MADQSIGFGLLRMLYERSTKNAILREADWFVWRLDVEHPW
jgi:hypothetical protein